MALSGRNEAEFEDIGKKIAKKCKGLTLAAKTLGSLLHFKSSLKQWSEVLNSEIWQMEEAEVEIFPHLLLSYNELTPTIKHCFSYCAFFPKDTKIYVESLIQAWMALGYLGSNGDMELKGRKYFDVLATRSLFQDFKKGDLSEIESCKMHDIVNDFAQFIKKRGAVEATGGKTCRACDPSHVSMVNEFCTLSLNDELNMRPCDCFVHLRVLIFGMCKSIPKGLGTLIHLRWLALEHITEISREDFKVIFHLYHKRSLSLCYCNIEEIPKEIGNLVHLIFLDLSNNELLEEFPMEIGNLIHLRQLVFVSNFSLKGLPESLCGLQELEFLNNVGCGKLWSIPKSLVCVVSEYFPGGIGGNKLELLKNSSVSGDL